MDSFDTQMIFLSQASQPSGAFDIRQFIPFFLIFIVIYFLIIRPQTKKQQLLEGKRRAMRKGDRFVTTGGIWAKVDHFKDERTIVAIIAPSVKVEIVRDMVLDVMMEVDKKGHRIDGKNPEIVEKKPVAAAEVKTATKTAGSAKKKSKSSAAKSNKTHSKRKK